MGEFFSFEKLAICTQTAIVQTSGATMVAEWGSVPGPNSSGKASGFLSLVGSLQYRTMTNCMYWFPLPIKLTS